MTKKNGIKADPRKANLTDFVRSEIVATIVSANDDEVLVTMDALTQRDHSDAKAAYPDPTPNINGVDPITKRPLLDFNDPAYKRRVEECQINRNYYMLARSLKRHLDIPGETDETRAAWLRDNFDLGIGQALIAAHASINNGREARVQSRAEMFHVIRTADTESAGAIGVVE